MTTVMCWLVNVLYKIKCFKNIHKPFICKTTSIQKNILKSPRIITFPLAQESFSIYSENSSYNVPVLCPFICEGDVMDVVFSVCIVSCGAVGARVWEV